MTKTNWVERIEARTRRAVLRSPIPAGTREWLELKIAIRLAKIKQDIKQQKENENE